MSSEQLYQGRCFCGAVEFTVSGEPVAMGYCHCQSCRQWSAGPVNAFSLWKPEALSVTRGADKIDCYNKTPGSSRKWCKRCGGHLFTDHPGMGLVDVYAALLPQLAYVPALWFKVMDPRVVKATGCDASRVNFLPAQRKRLVQAFGMKDEVGVAA